MIDGGVKIYEYSSGFIHGKVFVSDDIVATVGTISSLTNTLRMVHISMVLRRY